MKISDFWWRLYIKYFSQVDLKEKFLLGFVILFFGPVITLSVIAFISLTAFFIALPIISALVLYFMWVFSGNMSHSILALTRYVENMKEEENIAVPNIGPADKEVQVLSDAITDLIVSLRKERERLDLILDNMGEALYVVDENLMVTHFNRKASELLGYSKEEIIGKRHCYEFTFYSETPKCHTEECSAVQILRGQKQQEHREVGLKTRTGEEFPAIITNSPLYQNGTSRIVGVVKLVRDLRDLRTVQRYARELEKSNQMKDLFTDVLHHDLLNPAGTVNLSLGMMIDESEGEFKEMAQKAKSANDTLIAIIDNATKLSRIADSEKMDKQVVNLHTMFRDAEHNMESDIEKKGVEVEYNVEGDVEIEGSPLLYDVCSNLLSNAIKYGAEKGRIWVDISGTEEEINMAVADEGEGVPDKYKEAIFQRFQRRAKEGIKGTGLGLAIIRRIVELHKGKIWVEDNEITQGDGSTVTQGAVFRVKIPRQ